MIYRLAGKGTYLLALMSVLFYPPIAATAAVPNAQQVAIDSVRIRPSPERTRLVFDLGGFVDHSVFILNDPLRLVIDIQNARLNASLAELDLAGTPVSNLRSAVRNRQDLRVVLDLTAKIKPRSFVLKPILQYGDRLVIDLYGRDKLVTTVRQADRISQQMKDVIIAIDAGHGGDDPGAVGHGKVFEKDIVLAIARQLQKLLEKEPGYKTVMIRSEDYYVGLRKRTTIARRNEADLFISIHADAFKTAEASGASVYAISQKGASSEQAEYLAERENRADLIGGVDSVSLDDKDDLLAGVLLDLAMTASLNASLEVGSEILKSMRNVTRLHKKGVEQAAFAVLKRPDIPSILIETGYISNPDDAAALKTKKHQKRLAKAIYEGVKIYMENNSPPGSFLAWKKQGKNRLVRYTIVRGDTLSAIAQKYRVSADRLRKINRLRNDVIRIGQVLQIPTT
jgi:N-acetylmuramoyl-L-alanine amidase|tara:strand:- start:1507 stop:2868 length:1362 start_codon:yes stop_codon:yes gene_type:complete